MAGLTLSETGETTTLDDATVAGSDWLPGTVAGIYGSSSAEEVARREHLAAPHRIHPGRVIESLPLQRFDLDVQRDGERVSVDVTPLVRKIPFGPPAMASFFPSSSMSPSSMIGIVAMIGPSAATG